MDLINFCRGLDITVSVAMKSYQGIYEQDGNESCMAELYLLIYLEILPILEQEYRTEIVEGTWNKNAYIEFMNSVADTFAKSKT